MAHKRPHGHVQNREWRPIAGFPGYEVSSDGQVLSYHRNQQGSALKQTRERSGHMGVTLVVGGRRKHRHVHRLMAEAFLGPPPAGHEVRHLDGDPAHNQVENLAWGTHRDNMIDQIGHGTHNNARKTRCGKGHTYDEVNTGYSRRDGGRRRQRYCRTCDSERRRPANVNQTGSGIHKDRRTNRERDRSARERRAVDRQIEESE